MNRLPSRIRTRLRTGLLAAALGLAAAAPLAQAAEIRVDHAQGQTVLAATPKRVAVFDLASLDTLRALGVDVAGVPGSRFPDYLSGYADERYRKVGTLFEPDYDALKALAPDLIIVGGRSSPAYARLSEIAPTIDLGTGTEHFIDDVVGATQTLGRIFGKQEEAKALSARVQEALARLHASPQAQGSSLVLFAVGGNLMPVEPGSRFGIIYEFAGMKPVLPPQTAEQKAAAAAPRPEPGSPEAQARRKAQEEALTQALAAEPDWIFVLDRGSATGGEGTAAKDMAANPAVSASAAWKAGRVIYLDPPTWYLVGGGAEALMTSAASTAAALAKAGG